MTNPTPPAVRTADVKRELLVRLLRVWAPAALQRARRVSYVHGYADGDGGAAAQAALRALAGATGPARGRELVMIAMAADPGPARLLAAVQREHPGAAGLVVHTVPGSTDQRLGVALQAAGAARAPVFGFLDAVGQRMPPAASTVSALAAGRPVEVLMALAPSLLSRLAAAADPAPHADEVDGDRFFGGAGWRAAAGVPAAQRRAYLVDCYRATLNAAGFPLVSVVELVTDGEAPGELLIFATTSGRSLEGFKDTLWAVRAGAGLRDPGAAGPGHSDPGHPDPGHSGPAHSGPLGRRVLARLGLAGRCTVTELRTFTLTETAYRAADATRVLGELLAAGLVARDPEHGRLGGDVVITVAEPTGGQG